MKAKPYFLCSLLLPIIVPLVLFPMAGRNNFAAFLFFSLIYGGAPYTVFLVGAYCWAIKKSPQAVQRMTFIAPLIVALIFFFALMFFLRTSGGPVAVLSCYVIVLGYAYVAVVNGVFYLLKAGQLIKE